MHVDDFLYAGSQNFRKRVVYKITQKYEMGKHQGGNFKYVGIGIIQTTEGIKVQQSLCTDGVEEIAISRKRATEKYAALKNDEIRSLRALTGQLNWVATQIWPDVSYDVLDLSMKLKKHPTVEDLLTANKTVKKLKVDQKSGIFFPEKGDFEDLKFDVFCDAAHANLPDGCSSCQGHIILSSGSERCCPLTWSSHKTRRVVQSSLSAEALAMLGSLDEAMYLKSLLSELLYNNYKANKLFAIVYTDKNPFTRMCTLPSKPRKNAYILSLEKFKRC